MTDTNFDIWKRVAQEQYPYATDTSYQTLMHHAATDWALERDTNIARLFEQYVMLKNLINPKGVDDGN